MTTESGGLSKEEFMLIQEQLLQLRNDNYELREKLKKKNQVQNSPKNEALQFASKLINRAASSTKKDEKDAEIDGLRRKLEIQEGEFKLQQETLFEEMKHLSTQNEQLKTQIATYSNHPLEKEAGGSSETSAIDVSGLEKEIKQLKEEKELLCQETVPSLNKKISSLKEQLENCETLNVELEDRVLALTSEAETIYNEKETLDEENCRVMEEIEALRKENQEIVEEIQHRNREVVEENQKLSEEKKALVEEMETIHRETRESKDALEKENDTLRSRLDSALLEKQSAVENCQKLEETLKSQNEENSRLADLDLKNLEALKNLENAKKEVERCRGTEISRLTAQLDTLKAENSKLTLEIEKAKAECVENREKVVEDRILLLETRFQLEVDDQKKSFEAEREEFRTKIRSLEEKLKSQEEEKKISMKKHQALVKELHKTLKEERKRADSYERKSEERAGWHVVPPESDRQSSHTFDGNESVSSLSAIESENVELITRLATLQKIHSENADTILQLESENSRLRREVTEKGELIENLIREKPLGFGNPNSPSFVAHPKLEVSFRKLLNTLSQDSNASDVKEMNKKLQRMLEETLSKNIILQRDLQTLMERTGM